MKLEMARFLKNKEQMLYYLARENVVPVKSPPWADHPFELRRNQKMKRGQIGQHLVGKEIIPLVMELLGVKDERSCREVRERIKHIRQQLRFK